MFRRVIVVAVAFGLFAILVALCVFTESDQLPAGRAVAAPPTLVEPELTPDWAIQMALMHQLDVELVRAMLENGVPHGMINSTTAAAYLSEQGANEGQNRVQNTYISLPPADPNIPLISNEAFAAIEHFYTLDIQNFLERNNSSLAHYTVEVAGEEWSAARVIMNASIGPDHFVNPKMLLALLEASSGLITGPAPEAEVFDWAMGNLDPAWRGFRQQIDWAAFQVGRAYADQLLTLPMAERGLAAIHAVEAMAHASAAGANSSLQLRTLQPELVARTYDALFGSVTPSAPIDVVDLAPSQWRFMTRKPYEGEEAVNAYFDHDRNDNTVTIFTGEVSAVPYSGHTGWDYNMHWDEAIYSVATGTIAHAGINSRESHCYGENAPLNPRGPVQYVAVDHDVDQNGDPDFRIFYYHLNNNRQANGAEWTGGQGVQVGTQLGLTGNTGIVYPCPDSPTSSNGTHLHYMVYTDPVRYQTGGNIYPTSVLDPFGWWSDTQADPFNSRWLWHSSQIVDNRDPSFHYFSGEWLPPLQDSKAHNGSAYRENNSARWAVWGVMAPVAGEYHVEIHVPDIAGLTYRNGAQYTVYVPSSTNPGRANRTSGVLDQQDHRGGWVKLNANSTNTAITLAQGEVVLVKLQTASGSADTYTVYDAVRLVAANRSAVDVALIIDSSGSMSWNDPRNLRKEAARVFIDAMQDSDQIAVVDFDSVVRVAWSLAFLGNERSGVRAAINTIDSNGGTNIGAGLQAGYNELNRSTSTVTKAAVLLTDGIGSYNQQAAQYAAKGWRIYTIGLSDSADEALLQRIAQETGGKYFKLQDAQQLVSLYFELLGAIADGTTVHKQTALLQPLETQMMAVNLPSGQTSANFLTNWQGSTVDTTLVDPSGRQITPAVAAQDSNIAHSKGLTFELYRISNPKGGNWKVQLFGADLPPGGEDVTMTTSVRGLEGHFAAYINAPSQVDCGSLQFTAQAWVINDTNADFASGTATITLPSGLALATNQSGVQLIGQVMQGEQRQMSWDLQVTDTTLAQTLHYTVTFAFSQGPEIPIVAVGQLVAPQCQAQTTPGDCNNDQTVGAADLTALALEFFDGDDNNDPNDTPNGSYPGTPACDANEDGRIGASDLTCIALIFFNGPGACQVGQDAAVQTKPTLIIPANTPAEPGGQVTVPIMLQGNGGEVSSLLFSIDFDQTWLTFDPTDHDQDGIPDAITFNLPEHFVRSVTFDSSDDDGELDILLASFASPALALPDGPLFSLTLNTGQPDATTAAAVAFSATPAASFGDPQGRTITGVTVDGAVLITGLNDATTTESTIYLPYISHNR